MSTEVLLKALHAVAERSGTPAMVFDPAALEARYRVFGRALGVDEVLYAVKCNPDRQLLALLVRLGSHFEVVAESELLTLLDLGCAPSRVIFANPIRRPADLRRARLHGIDTFVVDDAEAYEVLAATVPDPRCLLRVRGPLGSARYGLSAGEARALLLGSSMLRERTIGVSMHHGPFDALSDIRAFRAGLETCRDVCSVAGVAFRVLDIGGGFPDSTSREEPIFAACQDAIAEAREQWAGNLAVWAEPGRALAAPAFHLIMSVLARRTREEVVHYYVDDSVYGSYLDAATCGRRYGFVTRTRGEPRPSVIYGATCDGVDVIARQVQLPLLDVGSHIYCPNAGAYTTSLTNGFNGIRRPIESTLEQAPP